MSTSVSSLPADTTSFGSRTRTESPEWGVRPYRRGWSGWKIAGLAAIAAGVGIFIYFEPDLRRYLKIRHM